jgi:hypothetical protein
MHIGFIVLVVVLIAGGIALNAWLAAKRRQAMAAWAAAREFTFRPERDGGLAMQYENFEALSRGEARYAYNVCLGLWKERPLLAFDFHYETHSRDSKGRRHTHHHHFSAVIVKCGFPVKDLRIRAEGFFDKVGEFMGFDDIDFESAEFSRRFHVKAKDRKWAFDVLHPRAMEFLLGVQVFPLEFGGQAVIAWRDRRLEPADLEQAAANITGLLDLMPEFLVRQQREQAGGA